MRIATVLVLVLLGGCPMQEPPPDPLADSFSARMAVSSKLMERCEGYWESWQIQSELIAIERSRINGVSYLAQIDIRLSSCRSQDAFDFFSGVDFNFDGEPDQPDPMIGESCSNCVIALINQVYAAEQP